LVEIVFVSAHVPACVAVDVIWPEPGFQRGAAKLLMASLMVSSPPPARFAAIEHDGVAVEHPLRTRVVRAVAKQCAASAGGVAGQGAVEHLEGAATCAAPPVESATLPSTVLALMIAGV
jgi:hypothetical protein